MSIELRSRNDSTGHSQAFFDLTTGETVMRFSAVIFDEDFSGPGHSSIPVSGSPAPGYAWVQRTQKTAGSPSVAVVMDQPGGVIALALDATSEKQEASLYANDALSIDMTKSGAFECRLALSVIPSGLVEAVWGLRSAWVDGPDNFTEYLDFQVLGSGAVNVRAKDGVTAAQSYASGATLEAGAFHNFQIDATDPTDIRFVVDGLQVSEPRSMSFAAVGANAILQPYVSVYKASGIGSGTLYLDMVQCGMNRS